MTPIPECKTVVELLESPEFYDKRGIPVREGDVLKLFHYVAAHRREKRFMYKQVLEANVPTSSSGQLLKIGHLTSPGYYWQVMDGKIHSEYEIVASRTIDNGNTVKDFRDRKRKPRAEVLDACKKAGI